MNSYIPKKYKCLSSSSLRIIALITMFVDHFAAVILYRGVLYPNMIHIDQTPYCTIYHLYKICRYTGRIAFPIFCFQLVEGYLHTSCRRKYTLRLTIFALLSEIPFNLSIGGTFLDLTSCNVFFTLLIGFLVIWVMDILQESPLLMPLPVLIGCGLAYMIQCDYDYRGIILIVLFYTFRYNRGLQTLTGALSLYWEWPAIFAFVPINLYNGKKGRKTKYFSYFFYPTHLLLLYFVLRLLF